MEPLLPEASALGRPRATDLRTVMNAILYIASTGCQWRQLPKDFPPYSTVQGYFYAWSRSQLLASINHRLVMAAREAQGREANRCRRLAKDFEATIASAVAWLFI